jgi:hypothetical protein
LTTPPAEPLLQDLRCDLDVLASPDASDWAKVADAAGRSALRVWEELQRQGLFEGLPPHDQAAVHYALALGNRIQSEPRRRRDIAYWRPLIDELRSEIAHFATWWASGTRAWPEADPDRAQQGTGAVELRKRLIALPPSWQHHILERLTPVRRYGQDESADDIPALAALLRHAEEQTRLMNFPPAPGPFTTRLEPGARGQDVMARLLLLPEGWQTEVVRRLAAGAGPLASVSDAGMALNIIRVFGVRLAWNATTGSDQ